MGAWGRGLVLGSVLAISLIVGLPLSPRTATAEDGTHSQSTKLAKRTARASKDVDRYVARLETTEQALWAVSQAQGRTLRQDYELFRKHLRSLEDAEKATRSEIHDMKAAGVKYAASWDAANAKIADAELKQASVERRTTVMKEYEEVTASLGEIGRQLQPFTSNLRDLEAFLGADLSPVHVLGARDAIQKSQADAQALKQSIAPVQARLKQFMTEAPR